MKLKQIFTQSLLTIVVAGSLIGAPAVLAAGQTDQKAEQPAKTKRVPAMRNRVYGHLALAQKVGEEQGTAAGIAKLDEVKGRIDQLNSYERAMLWNFYGFMHYNNEDVPNALVSFEKVIAEEAIPESLRLATMRSVGQLYMSQENYPKALEYLTRWKDNVGKELKAGDHVLFAQNYYQTKQYQNALDSIEQAVTLREAKNKLPKENWLVLQRAAYYELKQPVKVTEVLEKMVRLFNKPEHWVQLAGMYGEIEQEKKQLAVMEAAWQAGFITKGQDMINLAQLYLYHEVPFKAAKVIEEAIDKGLVQKEEKNLQLLSQAFLMAKNDDLAVNPLQDAAQIAEHGNFEAQLAEIYVNTEQWDKAIEAATVALRKGELNNPGNIHMALGMAHYNLNSYDASLFALSKAKLFKPTKSMATQWIAYVSKEQDLETRRAIF